MRKFKKAWHHFVSMIVTFSLAQMPLQALAITYNVNRVIDGKGTVSGFIETDGTIGPLLVANFIDWNLRVNDGSHIFNLLGPKSGANSTIIVTGNTTRASTQDIQFDCSGDQARIQIINPSATSPENGWALVGNFGGLVHDKFEEMCFLCSSSDRVAVTEHRSGIIKFPTLTNRIP
ncbi:hypothetical protein [Candidatus Nitrospira allomarina]|uniref:Uncharacterized protein n=1 Tax=Candidatus Nitrospira allomarina TaxID=3020900 RepID=A0AA96G8V2_9BACT|nr:hypothetical protein [Candidatus Nitrospira allomarina]WNM56542.1 hypothetical protein PP769_11165 [Candidatus Nitrospira allomarina]